MIGRLEEMSAPTLVQLACQQGQAARLSLRQHGQEAILYFDSGNIVHAALDGQFGEEVVYRVLKWDEGEFSLELVDGQPLHTIDTPWSILLVDGLQRRDEERWEGLDIQAIEEEYEMAENLNDILKDLSTQVTGYMACAVVGMDGLNLAQHASAPVDPEAISAQMTLLLKLVDTTVTKLGAGNMEDFLLTTANAYVLMRFLPDKNYYLGFAADKRQANLGNMRLCSRLFTARLGKALPH